MTSVGTASISTHSATTQNAYSLDELAAGLGVTPQRLQQAFDRCAEVVRERARNFYHGLKLTPEPRRSAIYSIYAWMRAADDWADGPEDAHIRRDRLAEFAAMTHAVVHNPRPGSFEVGPEGDFWLALAATVRAYPIDPVIFTDMLAGLEEDLDASGYDSDAELSRYCYRVAGTAGLACVWIWGLKPGVDPAHARELALLRGQAFQRTNILRDFAQDFDEKPSRVYLPREVFARHGVTPADVRAWANADRCEALIGEQAAIARRAYTESEPLESMIDPACAPTLWAMTKIYAGLLEIVERSPSRVSGGRRIRLPGTTKASIALRAAVLSRVGRW